MKLLPAPSAPVAPMATFRGALANIGKGLYQATARFANYAAASPTATTTVGGRNGSNLNSANSQIQRVGMNWTAEDVYKNSCIAKAYILQRVNYCSSMMTFKASTGDTALDAQINAYLHGMDGNGGVFATMGVDCSMQDAFSRTADIETPIRGDAGLIFWRDASGSLRLIEWSADQLGEIYNFTLPRVTSLFRDDNGQLCEGSNSRGAIYPDCVYLSGRYWLGADCVAYKIYQRTNAWYGTPVIYDAADVIYFVDPTDFRGVRGITKFATAIRHMEKGEALFQIGMDAAMRQAKTAFYVTNGRGGPDETAYNTVSESGYTNFYERVPGGPLIEYGFEGETMQAVSPDSPGAELIQGVETSDERVALALGLNYCFLLSATKVGGAPSRLEIEKATKEFARIQNRIHRPRLSRLKDVVLMDAYNRGLIVKPYGMTKDQFLAGRWTLPISPSVDAFYDCKENISMSRAGFEAPQDIIAETNRDADEILRKRMEWSVKVAMSVEDANKELVRLGYKPTVTQASIAQDSDNPQQAAAAEAIDSGDSPNGTPAVTASKQTAKMSAFVRDVKINELPEDVQHEIWHVLGQGDHGNKLVSKYMAAVPELLAMADATNLETARHHIRNCSYAGCADEVHGNLTKHVLSMNGKVTDGHHFIAKAEKGKVSKSLPVIDLTPARFQTAVLAEWDESKHPRGEGGKFGEGMENYQVAAHLKDKFPGLQLDIWDTDSGDKEVARITVPKIRQSKGMGTKAMEHVTAWADSNNHILTLNPSDEFGGDEKRLHEFYSRFGFVENQGGKKKKSIESEMYRLPKTVAKMAEWDESKHKRGQPGNKGEFGPGGGSSLKDYAKKQSTHLHETAQSKGHAGVNEFAANDPQGFSKTIADFQRDNPRSDAAKSQNLTLTKERAWSGGTMKVKTKLSKLETGALGENAVIGYLKDKGYSDARTYETSRNNAPIDLLQDHELIEVKTGFAGNGDTAQHWRATIGQPGPEETKMLKTMSIEDKKKWNAAKSAAILKRKTDELKHYSKETGRKAQGKTIATIINPDTRTIDIHEFDGFHLRIPWNSPEAKAAYKGSYKY